MKFNQNYSASRAALLLFWRVARIWQGEQVADFLDLLYEMWLSEEIAGGRISAPGFSDPMMKQAWLCSSWRGQPMPNIDPMKTAAANKTARATAGQHSKIIVPTAVELAHPAMLRFWYKFANVQNFGELKNWR